MQHHAEPSITKYPNQLAIYFAATRPPFLLATIIPILLGMAYTSYQGHVLQWLPFVVTLFAAVLLHAGVNVLNDYYDALNGTDDINDERIYPFTGGSRFIQNNVLSQQQTRYFGLILLLLVSLMGLYLVSSIGVPLLVLGLFGMIIGWAYSAPPLRLNSRGFGELTVVVGFALLPLGTWLSQTGFIATEVILIALPLGLLTSNLLYINQYPDRKADIQAHKMHWVARLPTTISRWGYVIIASVAWLLVMLYINIGLLPRLSLISLLPIILNIYGAKELFTHSDQPKKLETAIKMTLLTMLLHGGLLTVSLWF